MTTSLTDPSPTIRRFKPPFVVVHCYETDDFTVPRGRVLPSMREHAFKGYFGADFRAVRVGRCYLVDHEGAVVGEMLERSWRRLKAQLERAAQG